ncbi:hypothetical protein AA13595_1222 [Gluconacetobacter johannae DSM 13595]|uniref:Uncharacterized protein n=1 Tax=Gluconacetobacter johannae TaxID=112140 RepID=A0A7W4J6C3_9PROT|nr:hypothetical protein [Gluconacetobacter johannae]MBB2175565.1 hypothetical protein [Gluconacetobacter johannae]GBQ83633.1 hypothetical protein AA13595_1222 [Gluconacetobacter johannae DSM 13595]
MQNDPFRSPRPAPRVVSWTQSIALFCFGASILLEIGQAQWRWPVIGRGWPILGLDVAGAVLMATSLGLLWAARRR